MDDLIEDLQKNLNMLTAWRARLAYADFSKQRSIVEDLGIGATLIRQF